jgi:hypothetical protein
MFSIILKSPKILRNISRMALEEKVQSLSLEEYPSIVLRDISVLARPQEMKEIPPPMPPQFQCAWLFYLKTPDVAEIILDGRYLVIENTPEGVLVLGTPICVRPMFVHVAPGQYIANTIESAELAYAIADQFYSIYPQVYSVSLVLDLMKGLCVHLPCNAKIFINI